MKVTEMIELHIRLERVSKMLDSSEPNHITDSGMIEELVAEEDRLAALLGLS